MFAAGVTIGIPNWNHEYLLPRSVGSALRAVRDLRARGVSADVLVVDDFSRDGSLTLLRQMEALYCGDGLRVLPLPHNSGPAFVRNHMLSTATHQHILFLDADNEIVHENLYQFYLAITQTQAAVVYGNLIVNRGNPEEPYLVSHESFQDRILAANFIDTFALIDRCQALDSGGLFTNDLFNGREDWEFYVHLAARGRRLVFVPLVIGLYHGLPGSLAERSQDDTLPQAHFRRHLRTFNQLGIRERLPMNTRHLRYLPTLGYI